MNLTENQRIKDFFLFLKTTKKVRNQQDFTERIESDKSTVSQILNNKISIPKDLFVKIGNAFPEVSVNWLLTGEGEMLKPEVNEETNVREVGRPFKVSGRDEGVVEVRFFQVTPSATFQEFCEGASENPELVPIIPPPGETIDDSSCVFEIIGDSMLPQIPSHARVLCNEISPSRWHRISDGVIVIAYKDKFVIKRVIKNRLSAEDYIIIDSDNPDYQCEEIVSRADIRCLFEARQVLSYPIR